MPSKVDLPLIDLAPYVNPQAPGDQEKVIEEVKAACSEFGFFQVKGHGVPLESQKGLIQALDTLFSIPKEEKMKMSFLEHPGRRGYEASGMSHRVGDKLADSKEAFYIGREEPVFEPPGYHCPNVWPDLPAEKFHTPVWKYYQETTELGRVVWEILLRGLGHSPDLLSQFTKRPLVPMKMIRYPPYNTTAPGQFGVGPHNDFGGVTVLLQQPGKEGLEVWYNEEWLPVGSYEDVFVINCGDMINQWSGGVYQSAKHRVINKAEAQRLSCATFWHGDFDATNPMNPDDPDRSTIGQRLFRRFGSQFSLSKDILAAAS